MYSCSIFDFSKFSKKKEKERKHTFVKDGKGFSSFMSLKIN
jgi:hypothetical protein